MGRGFRSTLWSPLYEVVVGMEVDHFAYSGQRPIIIKVCRVSSARTISHGPLLSEAPFFEAVPCAAGRGQKATLFLKAELLWVAGLGFLLLSHHAKIPQKMTCCGRIHVTPPFRNPGVIRFSYTDIPTKMLSRGFKVVRNGFVHQKYVVKDVFRFAF